MPNVKLYLRKHKPGSNTGIVYVSFYISRKKINFSTKVEVHSTDWHIKKQKVGSTDKFADDKNLILDNILARVNDVFVKYRLRNKQITRDAFLRAYHRPSDFETFFDWVSHYQRKISARLETSTIYTHKTVINKIREYNPSLSLDDITREWLDDYFVYLKRKQENNDNTAYKNMSIIKKYIRAAFKGGYIDENPFEDWNIKRTTSNFVYLTEEELQFLLDLYQDGHLDYLYHKTLEFFLFLCFSSLHVGDAKALNLEEFHADYFTYYRMKLKNSKPLPIRVPISIPLRKILGNIVGTRKKGLVFEEIPADQTMNRILKGIAKEAGIEKALSHKVGRHTFATIFLKNTKDLASLKEILGHSSITETLVYAHVLDESKQEGIQCFNNFVF